MINKIAIIMLPFLFLSCANDAEHKSTYSSELPIDFPENKKIDEHNAQNALDWMGTYEGTLPCADCEGIKTTIVLNENGTYSSKEEYLHRTTNIVANMGKFKWDKEGMRITLIKENEQFSTYKVVENALIQLDMEGNEITGAMADLYRLKKK